MYPSQPPPAGAAAQHGPGRTRRADVRQNTEELFTYDTLNRVTKSELTANGTTTSVDVTYDRGGNITSKSDIGTYTYGGGFNVADACGGAGPRAVKAVSGAKTASYCYDGNGALISGDGRDVTWSAFGMPVTIEQGLRRIDITYGPDRARFKRVDSNETGQTTTHYVAGGSYESVRATSGSVTNKVYVAGVAVVIDRETTPGVVLVVLATLLRRAGRQHGAICWPTTWAPSIPCSTMPAASSSAYRSTLSLAPGDARSESRPPGAKSGQAPPTGLERVHDGHQLPVAIEPDHARLKFLVVVLASPLRRAGRQRSELRATRSRRARDMNDASTIRSWAASCRPIRATTDSAADRTGACFELEQERGCGGSRLQTRLTPAESLICRD